MGLKVAIVGLGPSRDLAPWDDASWELWGVAWDSERYRLARAFEMHDDLAEAYGDGLADYLEKISHCARLYTQQNYPFDEVAAVCGTYWESSLAYALALAITEGAEEIGIWGVSMKASEEYAYQRPNMEYLLGVAHGRGIALHIPDDCPLLKFSGFSGYLGRYGCK